LNEILTNGKTLAASATSEAPFEEVKVADEDPAFREEDSPDAELKPELLWGIQLRVRVELGRRSLALKDALRLGAGSVIDLERGGDDPVNLYVNDQLLARGVVMVVDDHFCVRVTEVLPPV
jgi:flagellar motor switch protein FliN